nr:hypothetical protein Iba_scaffold1675332CG0010 [Ipomoea batatas]
MLCNTQGKRDHNVSKETTVGTPNLTATKHGPLDHIGHVLALSTYVHLGGITECEESLVQVCSSTVCYETVTLHLTEFDTAKAFPVGHRLAGKGMDWASVAELHFVLSHMRKPLVECRAHENQGVDHFTSSAIVNSLVSPSSESKTANHIVQSESTTEHNIYCHTRNLVQGEWKMVLHILLLLAGQCAFLRQPPLPRQLLAVGLVFDVKEMHVDL